MSKYFLVMSLGAALIVTGCGGSEEEVTIPTEMVGNDFLDTDEVMAEAEEDEDVEDVTENEDGSMTITMSSSAYDEMMTEMEEGIQDSMEDVINDGEFASVEDVSANETFTEFTFVVDQEAYENSFDGFAAMGLSMSGMLYQLFDGVDPDDYEVTVSLENVDSGDLFDTIVYPDALEEMEDI